MILRSTGTGRLRRPQSPVGGAYNIASKAASLPFALTLPTAPTINSTVTAANDSELSTALASGTKRINCTGTFAGPITVTANDTHLDMTGATITMAGAGVALNVNNRSRVRVTGGTWADGFTATGSTDVHIFGGSFAAETQSNVGNALRIAIEKIQLTMSANQIALFGQDPTDLIIANSSIRNLQDPNWSQSTVRIQSPTRYAVIDCWLLNYLAHNLRVALGTGSGGVNVYYGRNLVDGGPFGDNANAGNITDWWIEDNDIRMHATSCMAADNTNCLGAVSNAITNRITRRNSLRRQTGTYTFESGSIAGSRTDEDNVYPANETWVATTTTWNGTGLPQP